MLFIDGEDDEEDDDEEEEDMMQIFLVVWFEGQCCVSCYNYFFWYFN